MELKDLEDEISDRGFVLIAFLAASNLSLVTTTQSKIAEDLDAFVAASWFTSAYMVRSSSISSIRLLLTFCRLQCQAQPSWQAV